LLLGFLARDGSLSGCGFLNTDGSL